LLDHRAHADVVLLELARLPREPLIDLRLGEAAAAVEVMHHLRVRHDGRERGPVFRSPRADDQASGFQTEQNYFLSFLGFFFSLRVFMPLAMTVSFETLWY